MRFFLSTLLVSAAVFTSVAARADDDEDQPEPEKTWYGGQTLATDGAALALAIASGSTTQTPDVATALGTVSLATYGLGAPVVHIAHGHGDAAVGSLLLRLGLPLGGALLGYALGAATVGQSSYCGDGGSCGGFVMGILGLGAGALTASILDATVLAYEPPAPRDASMHKRASVQIAPSFALVPRGREGALGTVGASGSF
jgi:hypothetical protein